MQQPFVFQSQPEHLREIYYFLSKGSCFSSRHLKSFPFSLSNQKWAPKTAKRQLVVISIQCTSRYKPTIVKNRAESIFKHNIMACCATWQTTSTTDKKRSKYSIYACAFAEFMTSILISSYLFPDVTNVNSVPLTFISDFVDILGQVAPARYIS